MNKYKTISELMHFTNTQICYSNDNVLSILSVFLSFIEDKIYQGEFVNKC